MKSGIYAITNTVNGKRYIGSAADIDGRWNTHRKRLRENRHHCIALQRAYNKYGCDKIIYEILYECPPEKDTLLFYEQWFMNLYGDYNSHRIAGSPLGYRHSEENKKLRRMKRGCPPVYQFDLEGNLVAEYDSVVEAIEGTGFGKTSIRSAIKYSWSINGFLFVHDKNKIQETIEFRAEKESVRRKKISEYIISTQSKPIMQIDLDGNILRNFTSISDAARELNVNPGSISQSVNHSYLCLNSLFVWPTDDIETSIKKYHNRVAKRFDNVGRKKIQQLDMNGNVVAVWDSLTDAGKNSGVTNVPNISAVLNGKRNQCGGFKWKFVE